MSSQDIAILAFSYVLSVIILMVVVVWLARHIVKKSKDDLS